MLIGRKGERTSLDALVDGATSGQGGVLLLIGEPGMGKTVLLDDIVEATQPRFVRISADWNVRGGIYTDVVAEYRKKGWKPAAPVALPSSQVDD